MEAFLGYLLGVGTVVAIAKRGKEAREVVAWTARQVGFVSGKVSAALKETSALARDEFERARRAQLGASETERAALVDAALGAPNSQKNGEAPSSRAGLEN